MSDRIAFELGSLTVYWYGVFVALGFMIGLFVMQWRARQIGFPRERVFDIVFAAMVGGIIGARLFYVVINWSHFRVRLLEIVMIQKGGLVFYGGFIGAALAILFICRKHKLDPWQVADLTALGVPTGQAFGRIGCLINGCCFGQPTQGLLGITYHNPPHETVWYIQQEKGLLTPDMADQLSLGNGHFHCLPVVPVQAYQSLTNVAILIFLIIMAPRIKHRGRLFSLFLMLYGIGRFLNEFNRGDYLERYAGLTIAQVICLFVVPAGIALWIWAGKRQTPPPADAPA